jgi:hypothetical protein
VKNCEKEQELCLKEAGKDKHGMRLADGAH